MADQKSIKAHGVYRYGHRELASGDLTVTFIVDASRVSEILPLLILPKRTPLNLSITDGEAPKPQPDDDILKERKKLYAKIQIHSDNIGYTEQQMRLSFWAAVQKKSRKDMSIEELRKVERILYEDWQQQGGKEQEADGG